MIADIVMAALALVGLGAFLYIIVDFVPPGETALQVVFALGLAMAVFDFARGFWRARQGNDEDDSRDG